MNTVAIVIAVLGVFWTQASSYEIYSLPGNNNDYVQQTVTINSEHNIVDIHVHAGMCSSDTIFDYNRGYIATRLFSRRACFVLKMEKGYIPEIEELGRLAYEKQMMKKIFSERNLWVQYEPSDSIIAEFKEWLLFGKPIEKLCRDVPIYRVHRVEGALRAGGCAKAGILGILGISVCGNISI
ncbi:gastrokine-2 isoform X2 [Pelodiscus sinensis]|uniref:gastrokine-2 isoform X2 n=1 Tax=Pelodiscus sinensis TaxID=13735 RepID=UPI003F6C0BE2